MSKTIAIVGLGLIGGSLAKAITKYTGNRVIGIEKSLPVIDEALSCGAIHYVIEPSGLGEADIIFLCLYPSGCIDFMQQYARFINSKAIVADVCGVKSSVVSGILPIAQKYGFDYIPGHPMAGKERGGFENSDADLFKGASYIITPSGCRDDSVEELSQLIIEIGFGRITVTTAEKHDKIIAFTSQIPHVLACAYMFSEQSREHHGYSAGSYRDISRVADINEDLWTQAFLENKEALSKEIDVLIGNLNIIKNAIDSSDRDELKSLLKKGGDLKRRLG